MEISVDVIDGCRTVARNLANDVISKIPPKPDEHYVHHIHGKAHHRTTHHNNDFTDHLLGNNLPDYKMQNDALVCMCGSVYAVIAFSKFRMREITKLAFSDPAKTDGTVTPVVVKCWTNNSKTEEHYQWKKSEKHSKKETYTSNTELGIEITYGLQTKVGGGVEGIGEAEVESSYEFKTNFTQRFEKSKETTTTEKESEDLAITVPAMTQTTLTRNKTISDWHQVVTTTGILDACVRISSDGDFGMQFESIEELQTYIQGGGIQKDWKSDRFFAQRHFQEYEIDLTPLQMTVKTPFTYRDVEVSDIIRNDKSLDNGSTAAVEEAV